MATLRKRAGKWQARVQRIGIPQQTKTFNSKLEAEVWARKVESEIDQGFNVSNPHQIKITLADLLVRYKHEITPHKKGAQVECIRINRILRDESICKYHFSNITNQHMATYRDSRLKIVSSTTVRLELALLSHVFNTAIKEWGLRFANPISFIKLPRPNKGRSRRLKPDEYNQLLLALEPKLRNVDGTYTKNQCRNPWMQSLVILATETAMRQSELLAIQWGDVDLSNAYIVLHDTKNGDARLIPLSKIALNTLQAMQSTRIGCVFPLTGSAVKQAFVRATKRIGLSDYHFHDLRHEATSRLAEKLSNVLELSAVTGHKDLKMLKRYYHPRINELVKKLD